MEAVILVGDGSAAKAAADLELPMGDAAARSCGGSFLNHKAQGTVQGSPMGQDNWRKLLCPSVTTQNHMHLYKRDSAPSKST